MNLDPRHAYSFTPDAALEALLHDLYRRFPPMGRSDMALFTALLADLGNPHLNLPPVFHVAGTNGKGSTLAFVQAVLESANLRVHKYTSPHLVRFEERVVLAGEMASAAQLHDALTYVAARAPVGMNFFSLLTAATFVLFAQTPADAVLLETGVGGTLDPTNVVQPEVSMITRISYDHMHLLGDTLAAIAGNKAGIIKPHRPVVVAPQPDDAVVVVIAARAGAVAAPLIDAGMVEVTDHGFIYRDGVRSFDLPAPSLAGVHQMINAATAIAAVAQSRFASVLDQGTVAAAMRNVRWPGRLQRIQSGPLAKLLGANDELWLDGAHNDSGAEVLANTFAAWRVNDARPIHVLTSFKGKKDWQSFVAPLLPHIDSLTSLSPDLDVLTARVLAKGDVLWADITAAFDPAHHPAIAAGAGGLAPHAALTRLFDRKPNPAIVGQRVVIAGSLYLAGHILRDHG